MAIQIFLGVLIFLIIWKIVDRYARKQIRLTELVIWILFWLVAVGFVFWPEASSRLADLVGIGRGADLLIYLGLILIFYLLFRIFVRFEKLERDITKIVRHLALHNVDKTREDEIQKNKP